MKKTPAPSDPAPTPSPAPSSPPDTPLPPPHAFRIHPDDARSTALTKHLLSAEHQRYLQSIGEPYLPWRVPTLPFSPPNTSPSSTQPAEPVSWFLLADLPMPWPDDAWEYRPSWRPAPGSNPWLPHPPGYLTPAPHTDYRLALPKYAVRAFMQAQGDAQRAKAGKLLRQIIADASAKGLLESTSWAAEPLPELAESGESDEAEPGGW